jgi:hypothetical protein
MQCPEGSTCTLLMVGSDVGACEPGCNPLSPTSSCPMETACRVLPTSRFEDGVLFHAAVCGPPAGSAAGTACMTSLNCAPSLYCAPSGTCRPLCNSATPCPMGSTCTPLDPPRGKLGYCA